VEVGAVPRGDGCRGWGGTGTEIPLGCSASRPGYRMGGLAGCRGPETGERGAGTVA
jgi:hypothetical protein